MLRIPPEYPERVDPEKISRAVDACFACAEACTACVEASLRGRSAAALGECIRRNRECAEMSAATATLLSRHAGSTGNLVRAFLDTCAAACAIAAKECAAHVEVREPCRVAAEVRARCEAACQELAVCFG